MPIPYAGSVLSGRFTYAKFCGEWCARGGKGATHSVVEVIKRNGDSRYVQLGGNVGRRSTGGYFYPILHEVTISKRTPRPESQITVIDNRKGQADQWGPPA